jgi:hypothetical protein
MPNYQFGSGNLYGLAGAVPVARKFGALQDVSVDISFTLKELYGQRQFPLTIARGQGKIEGKAKFASLNGAMMNDLFFNQTNATGKKQPVNREPATIPSTPFQVTVVNGATFYEDLGVVYTLTGVPLVRVASAPATGQYSVNNATGQYTFAAADTTLGVLIDYSYTTTGGNITTITNQLMGAAQSFALVLPIVYGSGSVYLHLNACISSKLSLATKLEDFLVPDFDFKAFADASDTVGFLSSSE